LNHHASEPARAAPASAGGILQQNGPSVELRWPLWLMASAVALALVCPTRTDPDLWGHVRFGLDWLHSHRLPAIDPYSFTQDRPWINHEWLSEAAMGWAFELAGAAGLVLLKAALVCSTAAIVARRLRGSSPVVLGAVVLLSITGALPVVTTIRPQSFSLLALAILMALADGTIDFRRRAIFIALLFALWGNLHGGWITGYFALVTYSAVKWLSGRLSPGKAAALVSIAASATVLNPYGVGLWRFLAATVRSARPDISEWQPMGVSQPLIMWFAALFPVALLVLLLRGPKERRPSIEIVVSCVVLILGGLRVSRVAPLVCPAIAAALGPSITRVWGHRARIRVSRPEGAIVLLVPAILFWIAALGSAAKAARCVPLRDTWIPDLDAARFLQGTTGRLWVAFDWGEYAIWHFGPALRVSIDGRRETVYSDAVVRLHRAFDGHAPDARAEFLRLAPEYVWLRENDGTVREWLTQHRYRIDVRTKQSFIAVRSDLPRLGTRAGALGSCFP
jgi:hypothetical protein